MAKTVTVFHGPYEGSFDFSRKSVSSVKLSLREAFQIPRDSVALVNGKRVADAHILRDSDTIEFVREAGKKPKSTVDPDSALPNIASMSLDELAAFVDGKLASLKQSEQQAFLHAHKSAVALYWAGCALYKAKELCEAQGKDQWKNFKTEHSLPNTTVNEAIRLFEFAKTPEALAGLGITEAKEKFVFHDRKPKSPKSTTRKSLAKGKQKPVDETSDEITSSLDEDCPDPTESIVEELNDVAQKLVDIAHGQLGTMDLQTTRIKIHRALKEVTQAVRKIQERIGTSNAH